MHSPPRRIEGAAVQLRQRVANTGLIVVRTDSAAFVVAMMLTPQIGPGCQDRALR